MIPHIIVDLYVEPFHEFLCRTRSCRGNPSGNPLIQFAKDISIRALKAVIPQYTAVCRAILDKAAQQAINASQRIFIASDCDE